MTAQYEIAFFKHSDKDDPPCGHGTKSDDITLQSAPNSKVNKVQARMTEGSTSALIWEGARVAETAGGEYAICLCNYMYFLATTANCSEDSHFSIHAGWLNARGTRGQVDRKC